MKSDVKFVVYVKETRKWRVKVNNYVTDALPHLKGQKGTFTHKVDAEEHARNIAMAYAAHKSGDLTSVNVSENTVSGLLAKYRQTKQYKDNINADSRRDYEHYFSIACKWQVGANTAFGKMLINNVTADTVDRLQAYIEQHYTYNCSFTTMTRLRTAWFATERYGIWRTNPFIKLGLARPEARSVAWTDELTDRMIEVCDQEGYKSISTMMIICLHFAQRIGDMRALKWEHIDFDYTCPRSSEKKVAFKFRQSKTGKDMMLYATPLIKERLKLHQRANTDDFVFRNDGDKAAKGNAYLKPYSEDLLRKRFLKLRRKHGLPENLWLADFRRSAATALADAGATESMIMSSTGHVSEEVLRRVYLIKSATQAEAGAKLRGIS